MPKILNFALKIKGGGREGGTCEVFRPATPQNLERAPSLLAIFQGVYISVHPVISTAVVTQTQYSRKTRKS